jgi:hypothetical protein
LIKRFFDRTALPRNVNGPKPIVVCLIGSGNSALVKRPYLASVWDCRIRELWAS